MNKPNNQVTARFLEYLRHHEGANYDDAWSYAYASPPQYTVTDAMVDAGAKVYKLSLGWNTLYFLPDIYRAMRALEPKG